MPTCASCGETNPARARFCMSCATPLPLPAPVEGDARKTVTVLFCDVVGSTPLGEQMEPESMRKVMTRFFEEMRGVIARHGGTVEKYIGDAVVAFFGTPVLHEDDALRAVRAAYEMATTLEALNAELRGTWGVSLRTRIGINTGEVVVGGATSGGALIVSDAVNVAARLEQTADPGDILLGPDTYALVRASVVVDEGSAFALKGKADPVTGYRLLDVAPGTEPTHRLSPAFVGRADEVQELRDALAESVHDERCVLLTVLGTAGVGKSRLAHEFAQTLDEEARVVRGRCLPYGDGITFWPVAELIKDACGILTEDSRETARARIERSVEGSDQADLIAERVAAVGGFGEASGEMQETFWAIRRFLECLCDDGPLVVLFDDVQWAEPTFLDLIEYLAGWTREAGVLLVCLARPDLLEARPGWAALLGAHTMVLTPLDADETEELIGDLLGAAALDPVDSARIVAAAEGNPLFVEEMLRMLEDEGFLVRETSGWRVHGDLAQVAVPASIQALLAARLDRLGAEEKTVLGTAAVIGKEFWWGAVAELAPDDVTPRVGHHLQTLVRKGLVMPAHSSFVGEDAFRFHHILVQEAAYLGLPKQRRAELHERLAGWIEQHSGERITEYEEVVGYHLEQAYRYHRELSAPQDTMAPLGARASDRLATAGRRALARGDMVAAANLLDRAANVRPDGDAERIALLPDLSEALAETGDLTRAGAVLDAALRGAEELGDRGLTAHATIVQMLLMESTDPKHRSEIALRELERVIPVFEELGDDLGLARAWRLTADVRWTQARYADVGEALERAIDHARRAGATWLEGECLGMQAGTTVFGPTPVPEATAWCERAQDSARANHVEEALLLRALAALHAMQGDFEEARVLAARSAGILEDLGLWLRASFGSETAAFVERLAGDADAAEAALRAGYEVSEKLGEQGFLATASALLARGLLDQGKLGEAEAFIATGTEAAAEDDLATQVVLHGVRGRSMAAHGDLAEAERWCREAVALADRSDDLNMRAEAREELAGILETGGDGDAARDVLQAALELFEAKGNAVAASAARSRLADR